MEHLKKLMIREGINDVSRLAMECSNMFYYSVEEQNKLKYKAIKAAFDFHYKYNDFYNAYCKEAGFSSDNLNSYADIPNIPLIPIDFFKENKSDVMLSLPMKHKQLEFHSSGTSGNHSVAYRDSISNEHAIVGLFNLYMELLDMRTYASPAGLFLTPSLTSAPNLGMLRALSIMNSFMATQTYIIEGNEFNFKKAVDFIKEWNGTIPIFIVGPPFIVNFFLEYLKANNITFDLGEKGRVITTGGWKRYTGHIIARDDFIQKCIDAFGIKPHQYRDMYGLIELNQLSIECGNHKKHVPPFSEFFIREIDDSNKLCSNGKEGLISIIDPTVMAYPGFLITQDVGVAHHEYECACGRTSTIMNIVGRAPKAEDINCSITLDQYLAGKTEKINHGFN